MAGHIVAGADALVMDARDHVATATKDLQQGQRISYRVQHQVLELTLLDAIPFGQNVAIKEIHAGTEIRKYGEVLGRTPEDIRAGQHVHVHNVKGIRDRGDRIKA